MLCRLVITLLPRSKRLLISWLQSPSAVILEPRKIKSATVSISIYHEVMGPDAMILVFWMLSFKPTCSLSSFTFIERLFSSSLSVWITINCGNSERDGNTRPPDLPLEKPVCRSGSNSSNWTWNNRLVPNKGVHQGCILSPCLFNLYAEYIMSNTGLEETQAGIKIAGRNINDLRYTDGGQIIVWPGITSY